MDLTAVAFNCTLKRFPDRSSCGLLLSHFAGALGELGVSCEVVRVADHDVRPGVSSDEGEGDEWPELRRKVLDADIFVMGTPIWLGHPSSICQRVMERFDALISETDDAGRMIAYNRVAIVGVVGNEDGAHHVGAEVFQGLNDVGFSVPATGMTYWVGEAMHKTDFKDVSPAPEKPLSVADSMVRNAIHLANSLQRFPYPSP
jgi:multimeric flavodoxin WrbA